MLDFDGVLVLGKELRVEPGRAMRELRARAAAAAAVSRGTGATVATLEARLKGQEETGSTIVAALLRELHVAEACIHREDLTRSTREEVMRALSLAGERGWRRLLVITARYHIPRARRLFAERQAHSAGLRIAVHCPAALLRAANPTERAWILTGEPDARTMRRECRTEALFSMLERAIRPLPLHEHLEVRAGAWLRGYADAGTSPGAAQTSGLQHPGIA